MSALPMYFPAAPFSLEETIACSTLVNTAYDMYAQWLQQDKPDRKAFKWVPQGPALQYSQPIWADHTMLWIFDHAEPFAFTAWDDNGTVYLIFRGTESLEDWMSNADADQKPYTPVPDYGHVHHGFMTLYNTMSAAILEALKQPQNPQLLLVSGHSLGAALSTLAVPDIISYSDFTPANRAIRHYNLASPRVGDPAFSGAYNANGVATYRVVNTCDIVPEVPPSILEDYLYVHVGTPVDFTAQYGTLADNHNAVNTYGYALAHPQSPAKTA